MPELWSAVHQEPPLTDIPHAVEKFCPSFPCSFICVLVKVLLNKSDICVDLSSSFEFTADPILIITGLVSLLGHALVHTASSIQKFRWSQKALRHSASPPIHRISPQQMRFFSKE
jgi:hypothetical protein